jgi:hypothetical protein
VAIKTQALHRAKRKTGEISSLFLGLTVEDVAAPPWKSRAERLEGRPGLIRRWRGQRIPTRWSRGPTGGSAGETSRSGDGVVSDSYVGGGVYQQEMVHGVGLDLEAAWSTTPPPGEASTSRSRRSRSGLIRRRHVSDDFGGGGEDEQQATPMVEP